MQAKQSLVQNYLQEKKVIIVGKNGCGKSSVVERYLTGNFTLTKPNTIGTDFHFKQIKHQQIRYKLNIFDTAGQQKYTSTNRRYYKGANGIILVFELDSWFEKFKNKDQFPLKSEVIYWLNQIKEHNQIRDYDVAFIGNKYDIICHEEQQLLKSFLNKVTQIFNPLCLQYKTKLFFGSAKTGQNIETLFQQLIIHFYLKKSPSKKQPSIILAQGDFKQRGCKKSLIQKICQYLKPNFK